MMRGSRGQPALAVLAQRLCERCLRAAIALKIILAGVSAVGNGSSDLLGKPLAHSDRGYCSRGTASGFVADHRKRSENSMLSFRAGMPLMTIIEIGTECAPQ
jgi:hypothetical protein